LELRAEHVTVAWGEHAALRDVTLSLSQGTHALVAGPASSGKTTLLKLFASLVRPSQGTGRSAGEVYWGDERVSALSPARRRALLARFGMVLQRDALFDSLTLLENVCLPLENRGVARAEAAARARFAIAEVGLTGAEHRLPEALSGGMKKRAALARALVAEPPVLLVDDPLAGLDPATGWEIVQLLERTSKARTLVVAAPEPPLRMRFSRWIVLDRGQVRYDGPPIPALLEATSAEAAR
jgi:phospholipid/cholesterol/gamma-HCH transport system ATP-binding protein